MPDPTSPDPPENILEQIVFNTLVRVGGCLNVPVHRSKVDLGDVRIEDTEDQTAVKTELLFSGAKHLGIALRKVEFNAAAEVYSLVGEGYPVLLINRDRTIHVFEHLSSRRIAANLVGLEVKPLSLSKRQVRNLLVNNVEGTVWVAKNELECDTLSEASDPATTEGGSNHGHEHEHLKPLTRFLYLLKLDIRDIWTISLFAFVAGVLALAAPLAVESLVNIVSWGTYLQPLIVVALMLLSCLGLAGVLRILQAVVVEIIQCRQFVRIVGDLAHRFPRADQSSLVGEYPRELANRLFDIMTIQKATATLLLDGISIVLTTVLGLLLLAFYHPFLLGFDIVLVISMISITWLLGRGGIRTAVDESVVKYQTVHWLQDVISSPAAFKVNGGENLAIERANQLTTKYLTARKSQFRVVLRQIIFAISLQVIASTVVLGLGGWLVITGELTLGQLVASELVVTVVVGAFAKAGKSLEKFYDLMAGVDKVGHLLDIPVDPRYELSRTPDAPIEVRWDDLVFKDATTTVQIPAAEIKAGSRVAILGNDLPRQSWLARTLAGLVQPDKGIVEIAGFEAKQAALAGEGRWVGYAGRFEVFHSTLQQNVDLGRTGIGHNRVRDVLQSVGLWNTVIRLPDGVQSVLQTDGYPLSRSHVAQLVIARAMAGNPRLLVIDGLLDDLSGDAREMVWSAISSDDAPWTLVVVTNLPEIADICDRKLYVKAQ